MRSAPRCTRATCNVYLLNLTERKQGAGGETEPQRSCETELLGGSEVSKRRAARQAHTLRSAGRGEWPGIGAACPGGSLLGALKNPGSGEAATANSGKRGGRRASQPRVAGGLPEGNRDPTALRPRQVNVRTGGWRTEEVGTDRPLLPGAPPALGLDLKTRRGAEQGQGRSPRPPRSCTDCGEVSPGDVPGLRRRGTCSETVPA